MADGTLSRYFERDKEKGARQGGTFGYSSAPSGDTGGGAASSGSAPASSGPKAPTSTGGSGFVNFGQYFGANAPAVQQQAQQAVGQSSTTKAFKAPQGASGLGMERPERFGPMPSASTMLQRQETGRSPSAQLSQIPGQMEGLKQASESGYMGANVSAFDQMLGGGLTQRAAQQEQQRLGALRSALEGQQAQYQQEQAARAEADRQAKQAAEWQAWWDNERRRAEYAEQQRQANEERSFWDSLGLGNIVGK